MRKPCFLIAAAGVLLAGCEKQREATEKRGQDIGESGVLRQESPQSQPTPALPEVALLGIVTVGDRRALLRVETPGKPPEPPGVESLLLGEGQKSGAVEVLDIDDKSASVRLKVSGVVKVVTLKKLD